MPKPSKKSKTISLVSAYESGAESSTSSRESSPARSTSRGAASDTDDNSDTNHPSGNTTDVDLRSDNGEETDTQERSNEVGRRAGATANTSNQVAAADENNGQAAGENMSPIQPSNESNAANAMDSVDAALTRNVQTNVPIQTNGEETSNLQAPVGDEIGRYTLEAGFPPGCEAIRLPAAPRTLCSQILQNKIIQVSHRMKHFNYSINEDIKKKKNFKNPSIYEKLIQVNNMDEFGSNFASYIPDLKAHGYMFHDQLDEAQREEYTRREKERKERTKIEMVSGTKRK